MPTQRTVVYSPGQLMVGLRSWLTETLRVWNSTYDYSYSLGSLNGYRTLDVQFLESGTPTAGYSWSLQTLADDETAPVDFFVRSPGWDGCSQGRWNEDEGPTGDFSVLFSRWSAFVGDLKGAIINSWSSGTFDSQSLKSQLSALDQVGTGLVSQIYATDSRYIVSTEELSACDGISSSSDYGTADPVPGALATNPGCAAPDLGPLIAAVEALSAVDHSVSLNQGAVLYSVGNKEVTTT